ncbi:hypothetical protein HZA42_04230 [Candidatus Peregrinibacteria bacterium]|nr:hypothetical protein [Candidatus Peregrinibacteria bacterium]
MEHTHSKSTPRDVFLYLLAIGTLYFSVWRFIDLLFEYINNIFPDPLDTYLFGSYEEIRLSMATLIILSPAYLAVTWFLKKDLIANPEKREISIRKWLLNLTLFLAAITIISDLVTLVFNFLRGDLTTRFGLKVLVVLVVAGVVFAYYFRELKRGVEHGEKPSKLLVSSVAAVILVSIIGGFFIIGSPATQRMRRFDEQRVSDLQNVQSQIVNYWSHKKVLPTDLGALKDTISGFVSPRDPETAAQYEYSATGSLAFKLCAVFNLPDTSNNGKFSDPYYAPVPMSVYVQDNWGHEEGRVCFDRAIDPQIYGLKTP